MAPGAVRAVPLGSHMPGTSSPLEKAKFVRNLTRPINQQYEPARYASSVLLRSGKEGWQCS